MYICWYFSFNTKLFYNFSFCYIQFLCSSVGTPIFFRLNFSWPIPCWSSFGQIEWALRITCILSLEQTSWTRSVTTTKFTEQNYGARKVRRFSSFARWWHRWWLIISHKEIITCGLAASRCPSNYDFMNKRHSKNAHEIRMRLRYRITAVSE